jgi:hypothetical protein
MNKRPTKSETRQQLESKIEEFIQQGGEIKTVESGATGLEDGNYNRNGFVFGYPKEERTPATQELAAIDARRRSKTVTPPSHTFSRKPKKKIIYDDFGEPIREVWVEE